MTGELTEAPALNAASMTIAELEDGNYVLSVSKKLLMRLTHISKQACMQKIGTHNLDLI